MKRMMKTVAALMLMTAVVFAAGCNKPDDSNNGNNGGNNGNNGNSGGNTYNGHEYVDLGLPSGTLWATCNVGASTPEEFGDYFAWGETEPKTTYNWSTYKYCKGDCDQLTKYCLSPEFGYNGFSDHLIFLQAGDDAATVNWGDDWRTPTYTELFELSFYCTETWTTRNGVNGKLFTAPNGNSLFLPAAGNRVGGNQYGVGDEGCYWSKTSYYEGCDSEDFEFYSVGSTSYSCEERYYGLSVRPVRLAAGGDTYNGHEYVDLGLPSGTLWATCNVGATTPDGYGDYFAWGETEPKTTYNWSTYKYANGDFNQLTKYCNSSNYGYNGFTDNLTILQVGDDAATVNWGDGWCMPTNDQWQELYQNTITTWAPQKVVKGRFFTAPNGNSLFLPAAGDRWDDELGSDGDYGYYWSSSLYTDYPDDAWFFGFSSGGYCMIDDSRYWGKSVRPVRSSGQN